MIGAVTRLHIDGARRWGGMRRVLSLAALATLSLAGPIRAEEQVLRLDAGLTKVDFTLDATLHAADGTLACTSGEVRFDLQTGAASGRLVFDAAKTQTGHEGRDRKMHEEVLESARFPEIVFTPAKLEKRVDDMGNGDVRLTGTLAIHGADHPFTIAARVRRNGDKVSATGSFDIPYVAWGMRDPSVFVLRVAKVVKVRFSTVGTLTAAAAADAP